MTSPKAILRGAFAAAVLVGTTLAARAADIPSPRQEPVAPVPLAPALGDALALLPLAGLFSHALHAAPYVPRSDDEVVQHLPTRLSAGERQQRQQLARVPQNLPLALATARAAIERARALGDPRELGVAQAALGPWWNAASPPPAALRTRWPPPAQTAGCAATCRT